MPLFVLHAVMDIQLTWWKMMAWLMCPQFCSLTGEKKWRRIMMVMLAKTETLANRMLPNNIRH